VVFCAGVSNRAGPLGRSGAGGVSQKSLWPLWDFAQYLSKTIGVRFKKMNVACEGEQGQKLGCGDSRGILKQVQDDNGLSRSFFGFLNLIRSDCFGKVSTAQNPRGAKGFFGTPPSPRAPQRAGSVGHTLIISE